MTYLDVLTILNLQDHFSSMLPGLHEPESGLNLRDGHYRQWHSPNVPSGCEFDHRPEDSPSQRFISVDNGCQIHVRKGDVLEEESHGHQRVVHQIPTTDLDEAAKMCHQVA